MKHHFKYVLSGFLAFTLLLGVLSPSVLTVKGMASSDGERIQLTEIDPTFDPRLKSLFVRSDGTVGQYQPDDVVRVSIVLKKEPTIDKGYPINNIGRNKDAASYHSKLEQEQDTVTERIEKKVLDGEKLDVVTNLTLVANLISADVKYSQIEEIEKVSGVKEVIIERVYEPFEYEKGESDENSAAIAKALTEYTGVGARIAIIDSGVNHDHEAFNSNALEYSLRQSAPDIDNNGKISDEELVKYKDSLNFMTKEDVEEIIKNGQLHATVDSKNVEVFYHGSKIPFAYNYCDNNFSVKNAEAGFHGSHVSGIAAANTYLSNDGKFVKSDENGGIIGTAPDAQILNLKVMGAGACTDSVIAAAIEDAVLLGADVMNLSLGIAEVGFSCAGTLYGDILDNLSQKGILVMGAVGNDGSWLSANKKLYAEDVNLSATTPPSSYAEFIGVAWANKNGIDGQRADIEAHSAYGIPSSLMLQPEITAAGTKINSVNGNTDNGYAELSGTSMASPDVAGAAAVVNQYIQTKLDLFGKETFLSRAKEQSKQKSVNYGTVTGGLLMSTADPMRDSEGRYYSLLRQGSGLLNTKNASSAKSFIEVSKQTRGRVKAEVGDSPDGQNVFSYSFTLHNVSNQDRSYSFKTDLFTEDTVVENNITYLADYTRSLTGKVTYMIGDKPITFQSALNADVDQNGVTDYDDAQALLDYLSGERTNDGLNLSVADVDGDKTPTTYDAHVILQSLASSSVLVNANSSITVDVTIEVIEDVKDNYPNGFYLEGFTYVDPVNGNVEESDVTHSIPILGFCGNWSDPSMFDRNSYIESQNNSNETVPYTETRKDVYDINYLEYQDPDGNILRQTANPFDAKNSISIDRLAMGTDDIICDMKLTLIRPAGALCFAVMKKDENGNRSVLYMDAVWNHVTCIYPTRGKTSWNFTPHTLSVHVSLEKMLKDTGVKSGDKIEIGAVAVPEYYEESPGKEITKDWLKALIENGVLGKGAYMTTEVTLDNEAPYVDGKEIIISEDMQSVKVRVKDDQHVAHIGLYSTDGNLMYTSVSPKGEDSDYFCTLSTSGLQKGGQYALVVGDYAGNYRMYRFTYGDTLNYKDSKYALAYIRAGEDEILTGTWVLIEPEKLNYTSYAKNNTGLIPIAYDGSSEMLAGADAADDYLWQAFESGLLYAAPIDNLNNRTLVADLSTAGMGTVRDLAFSEQDSMLYAVDGTETLWQIDPMTGVTQAVQNIVLHDGGEAQLYGLAIDKDGTVYATCYGEATNSNSLLKWSLSEQKNFSDVSVTVLSGNMTEIKDRYISLTWIDTQQNALYASCAANLGSPSMGNLLYKITLADSNCSIEKVNNSKSRIYAAVRGLVNLSAKPALHLSDNSQDKVAGITICNKPTSMLVGDTVVLSAAFIPWNVTADPAKISWASDQQQIVSVGENGEITACGEGTTKITASYTTDDGETVSADFEVAVNPAPSIQVSALLREGDGQYYFETFSTDDPGSRKIISGPQKNYIAGTMNHAGDCLYLRTSGYGFRVNPNDFSVKQANGAFNTEIINGDAAPGKQSGYFTNYGYLMLIGNTIWMVGSDAYSYNKSDRFDQVGKKMSLTDVSLPGSAAVLCYGEYLKEYHYEEKGEPAQSPADLYYVLTEDGSLCKMTLYDKYSAKTETLGKIPGVNLSNVSKMQEDSTASMIYDENSEMLVVVSKIGPGTARVQVIDPETCQLIMTREFEDDIRQIGILYQYDYRDHPAVRGDSTESGSNGMQLHFDENAVVDEQNHTVTVDVPVEGTKNGLTEVTYDSSVLTFDNAKTVLPFHSFHDDKAGTIKFAFANAANIESETVRFVFSYEPQLTEQSTKLMLTEKEKGNPKENIPKQSSETTVRLPAKQVEKELVSIEISGEYQTEYLEGAKKLNTEGLIVTAHYSNGEDSVLGPGDYQLSGFEGTPGQHQITVSYLDKTVSFVITVKAKSPQKIEVSTKPKTEYIEGMNFSDDGMVLTLTYDNGDTEEVRTGWTIRQEEIKLNSVGDHDIHISYRGLEAVLTVHVVVKSLLSVEVANEPDKIEYIEGTLFDPTGMTLTLVYDNGTRETVTSGWEIGEYDFSRIGEVTIPIIYEGKSTGITVKVIAKSLIGIRISKNPTKMEYIEGTAFDPTGMELTLSYNNGTEETIVTGWEIGEYDFSNLGEVTVPVTYKNKSANLTVKVIKKILVSIEVSTLPEKVTYLEGKDSLDVSGGKLTLRYNNGTTEQIDLLPNMVKSEFDNTRVGKQTVEVVYEGCTATFEVTVQSKEIEKIEIPTGPQKTEYIEGTKFDPTGMEITVHYNNGSSVVLYDGWELDYDFSQVGESKVTVFYQGHEASFAVTVKAKTLTNIEVSQAPSKVEYVQGETFDPTGMKLTLYYDNGTSETVSEGWTLNYNFSKSGLQSAVVSYGGVETSLTVTVIEKQTQPSEPQNPVDPQQPIEPQNPDDSSTDKKDEDISSPQTGDDSHIGLWLMLMLLSGGALAVISARRKQRSSDSKG